METVTYTHEHLSTLFTEVGHFSDFLAEGLLTVPPTTVVTTARKRHDVARASASEMPRIIKAMQVSHQRNADKSPLFDTVPFLPLVDLQAFRTALWASRMLVQQSADIIPTSQVRAFYKAAIARTAADAQALAKESKAPFAGLNDAQRQAMFKAAQGQPLAAILGLGA